MGIFLKGIKSNFQIPRPNSCTMSYTHPQIFQKYWMLSDFSQKLTIQMEVTYCTQYLFPNQLLFWGKYAKTTLASLFTEKNCKNKIIFDYSQSLNNTLSVYMTISDQWKRYCLFNFDNCTEYHLKMHEIIIPQIIGYGNYTRTQK